MRRLFLRTYLVLAAVLLGGLAIATAWEAARRRPPDDSVIQTLLEAPDDVRAAFGAFPPPEATDQVEEALGVRVFHFPLDRLPPHAPPRARVRLKRGAPAGPRPGGPPELWVPVPERGLAVHVIPRRNSPPPVPVIAAGVLLLLGAGVAWQLVPLERDLKALAVAARDFGAGDHNVRVDLPTQSAALELGDRFNTMAERIEQLLEAQRELLLAVSHELRTPLHRVRFAAELLAQEAASEVRAEQLEALQQDLDELDGLVGELLTWGRLAEERPRKEPVALVPLVGHLLDQATRLRSDITTTLTGESAITLDADLGALRRALGNLIHNAARHARSHVKVHTLATRTTVTLHVDDDGPGIPVADRERILEPFVRLDEARDRDAGGAGLGLALAARVAQVHGGRLTVDEGPLGGARLTLELPLTEADAT